MKLNKSKTMEELPEDQKNLGLKVLDLVIDRVLRIIYFGLSESEKLEMEEIFSSDNDKEKERFIKKYALNFKDLFKGEAKKIEAELKIEIERQV